MVKLIAEGRYFHGGEFLAQGQIDSVLTKDRQAECYKRTMAYSVLSAHTVTEAKKGMPLQLKFDALASHDITYVGIVQTAKASGLTRFPIPYVLTNCHNSLCAVGGTINEDDHRFGLSAAVRYGGIYVPPHQAVIHTYMRECMSKVGRMILGSDSHTRYGALGVMAVGEGGPELVKQLLGKTYDINYPDVIAVHLTGKPSHGVGPQDVALSIIKAVFSCGFVKNKVLEFVGDGIASLPIEFRNGIDVMTTETTCLSSIWMTDERVRGYYSVHGREEDFAYIAPADYAYYDGVVQVDLSAVTPKIALPFHPSNVYDLADVIAQPYDIFAEVEKEGNKLLGGKATFRLTDKIQNGKVRVEQGVIAGCAGGTYDNIALCSNIMKGASVGCGEYTLSVYPSSQPVYLDLLKKGYLNNLISSGAIIKTAFCGPCFGAGDVPSNNSLSIRHTTRNFENREGSKSTAGQMAGVALMDAASIAATSAAGGVLTSAATVDYDDTIRPFEFDGGIYRKRVFFGYNKADSKKELKYGPNIADWPKMISLTDNVLLKMVAVINDPVTTTDELIPSGETSSYRSNPEKLSGFALSRKVPEYVGRAKAVRAEQTALKEGAQLPKEYAEAVKLCGGYNGSISIGSAIYAVKPGDGSAREQAASCQKVLGGFANIAKEYATKRYRSNLINWGMLPLLSADEFRVNDLVFLPDIRAAVAASAKEFKAKLIRDGAVSDITLTMDALTSEETAIILDGCLINHYNS